MNLVVDGTVSERYIDVNVQDGDNEELKEIESNEDAVLENGYVDTGLNANSISCDILNKGFD